jgi:predicted RND superfamily exporter protein
LFSNTKLTFVLIVELFHISTGIDDALIIMGSYARTDCKKNPVERIAGSIDDIGISITLTTATSAAAFAVGCITKFPAVSRPKCGLF